jgi:predicted RNA-binding protein
MKNISITALFLSLLLVSFPVLAETTVVVDDNNKVTVSQGAQTTTTQVPVSVTNQTPAGSFEGRVVEIDYPRNQITVQDANGINRQVTVKPETTNSYRIGDYVQVRSTADVTLVTLEENPKDFEGEIIRVDQGKSQIMVLDTNGRERRVQLKQGMISNYKVDDYVRIHLMADLKEAKTIQTIDGMRKLEGTVSSIDYPRNQLVIRDTRGTETPVIVRQGLINGYRVGDRTRIYILPNHEDVQLIRVLR